MDEEGILKVIEGDTWMMEVLRAARSVNLPDWMIGAGFVRNKIWDYLHGYERREVPTSDIDLIYYDPNNLEEAKEKEIDGILKWKLNANWSTKNQARMHGNHNKREPYKNSFEALSEWVETPTCVAVKLEGDGKLTLLAPHGIDDLVNLIVRPTPAFKDKLETFWGRVNGKEWQKKWPRLKIVV